MAAEYGRPRDHSRGHRAVQPRARPGPFRGNAAGSGGCHQHHAQDHFDYHADHASYRASKGKIFQHLKQNGAAVLNADDPAAAAFAAEISENLAIRTYGIESPADVTATRIVETLDGSRFTLTVDGEQIEVSTPLVGRHNVSNCLAAAAAAMQLGMDIDAVVGGIEASTSFPGRLERVECGQRFKVFVDYAHTDDACGGRSDRSPDFLAGV